MTNVETFINAEREMEGFPVKWRRALSPSDAVFLNSWSPMMNGIAPGLDEAVVSKSREKLVEPPMYRLLLHNDDYTTMEFVVEVLMMVCHKSLEQATRIMLNVHRAGVGVCGVYTHEIAETKSQTIQEMARDRGFPLKSSIEKA